VGLLRGRLGWILVGLLVGAATGAGTYYAIKFAGQLIFALLGAALGIAAGLGLHAYRRTARLTHVVVTIPQLSELHFVMDDKSRQTAWRFYVETVTRVSAQPLQNDSGSIREALSSLYGLFAVVRSTLNQSHPSRHPGNAPTVELLAISMLNNELRPFLSRWHPDLKRWETTNPTGREADWPGNVACRDELAEMQGRLLSYVLGFAKLAGIGRQTAEAMLFGDLGDAFRVDTPHQGGAVATASSPLRDGHAERTASPQRDTAA
jgi:hypothetical protein